MKQHSWFNEWQINEAAPTLSGGTHTRLDGTSFFGKRGCLAVALHPASLAQLREAGGATHWLIPVESVAMVKAAASLSGEVLWLCGRHPSEVLGQLDEAMRGAWLEGDSIVVNLDGHPRRVALPVTPTGKEAFAVLAQAVATLWTGAPQVASHRESIAFNQPQPALLAAA